MGIEHDLYIISMEEFDKMMADPDDWDVYGEIVEIKRNTELHLDMGKSSALTLFCVMENLSELYGLDSLKDFPYFKERVLMDKEHYHSFYKPDKVQAAAEDLKRVNGKRFDKAYAGADKFHDDDYTEEGRERFFEYDFSGAVEFFKMAAEKGAGVMYTSG